MMSCSVHLSVCISVSVSLSLSLSLFVFLSVSLSLKWFHLHVSLSFSAVSAFVCLAFLLPCLSASGFLPFVCLPVYGVICCVPELMLVSSYIGLFHLLTYSLTH